MKVYHGSYMLIDEINLSKCQPRRDFGCGFYVTKIRSQAEYWAKRKGKEKNMEGVVTEFNFSEYAYNYKELKTLRFNGYSDKWFDFIILNRSNDREEQAHDCDIVEGPVADDAITSRIYDYRHGELTKEQFLEELKYKKPTHQICFCTVQALLMLTSLHDAADIKIIHIDDRIVEAMMTDFEWTEAQATNKYYTSKTYKMLSDESTALYQKPWTEIYEMLIRELNLK